MDALQVRHPRAPPGRLDGVHVPEEVGHGGVGGGELLHVPVLPGKPDDGGVVPGLLQEALSLGGDGVEGVVAKLRGEGGNLLVQEAREASQDPAFRLAPGAEEDEVLLGEDGLDQGGDHRVLVAVDAGEKPLPAPELLPEVLPGLVLHGAAELLQGVGAPEFA